MRDTPSAEVKPEREVRRRPCGSFQCDRCGKRVTLWQETDEWAQRRDGKWKHYGYGPGTAECCGVAYLDSPFGAFAFPIEESQNV